MDNEKLQINFAPGQTTAQVIIREGEATKQLDPKAPVKTEIVGTIGTIREYLKKRVSAGQFMQSECIITVDRESVKMTLTINESDAYKRGTVVSKLQFNPQFVKFGINNPDKEWTPA